MEILPYTPKRTRKGRICVIFNGVVYSRYPNAKNWTDRMYFRCKTKDKYRGFGSLHRDFWKFHKGEIPPGYEIHHIDENPLNNSLDNLEMLTKKEHNAKHIPTSKQKQAIAWKKKTKEQREAMRWRAADWHKSPEGIAWHKNHAKEIGFGNPEPTPCVCSNCSKNFLTKSRRKGNKFCSNNCKSEFRRQAGTDDVSYTCQHCRKGYKRNKYAPNAGFCSVACAKQSKIRMEEITCSECGKIFQVVPSVVGRIMCCSRKCGGLRRSKEMRRKNAEKKEIAANLFAGLS